MMLCKKRRKKCLSEFLISTALRFLRYDNLIKRTSVKYLLNTKTIFSFTSRAISLNNLPSTSSTKSCNKSLLNSHSKWSRQGWLKHFDNTQRNKKKNKLSKLFNVQKLSLTCLTGDSESNIPQLDFKHFTNFAQGRSNGLIDRKQDPLCFLRVLILNYLLHCILGGVCTRRDHVAGSQVFQQ